MDNQVRQEVPVVLEHLVQVDHKDNLVHEVTRDFPDRTDNLDLEGRLDHLDKLEVEVKQDHLDQEVQEDLEENPDSKDLQVSQK